METFRKVMTDVLEGKAAAFVPFAPRLDIWYRSNKLRGTLPPEYRNASLLDVIDDLEVGYNTMIPDYLNNRGEEDYGNRGTGFYFSNTSTCYNIRFENVRQTSEMRGDRLHMEYETPCGTLTTETVLNDEMKRQGITICSKTKFLITSPEDYKAVSYLFQNAQVIPQYDRLEAFQEVIGDRGITTAIGLMRESPARLLQMELMTYEEMVYDMADYPEELQELMDSLSGFLRTCMEVSAHSPAQLVTAGGHFDAMLTPPPFFRQYMMPYLKEYSALLHREGKYMASHTDSDNQDLLPLYLESGIDVADSVCTKPLSRQDFEDIRPITGNKLTLYGCIPSIATLKSTMSDLEFDRYLDQLFAKIQADGARNIILSIADTTPPDAELDRIRKVSRLSRQLRPY